MLANLFGYRAGRHADRVCAVAGELTAPLLGLDVARWERLAGEVSTIVHGPPRCRSRSRSTTRARSTSRAPAGCSSWPRAPATTAGSSATPTSRPPTWRAPTPGASPSTTSTSARGFNNSYEQSKFEAEQLVRSLHDLPFTIMRPSIVVGDRHSGWTAAFNVLYWPLRALARGIFPAVPATPSSPVDVVSIDYVADAIHELCQGAGDVGQTYHLTAGSQREHDRGDRQLRERLLPPARADAGPAGRVRLDGGRRLAVRARGGRRVLPVLLGGCHVRRHVHAGPARAGRDQRLAAARLPRAACSTSPPARGGESARSARAEALAASWGRPARPGSLPGRDPCPAGIPARRGFCLAWIPARRGFLPWGSIPARPGFLPGGASLLGGRGRDLTGRGPSGVSGDGPLGVLPRLVCRATSD